MAASDADKCQHCLSGHIHSGAPKGSVVSSVGGVPSYIAQGNTTEKAILICTDIFGYELPNVRLIADKLASAAGFTVYVPDILQGDAVNPDAFDRSKFGEWRARHGDDQTMPAVRGVIEDLKAKHGVTKLAVLGYCFGGRYAALATAEGLTTAYGVAHPSFVSVADFQELKAPGMFLCAETDQQFPGPMADEVEKVLVAAGVPVEFRRYPGTTHGFAVRGNEDDKAVMAARDDALQGAADFFGKHLA